MPHIFGNRASGQKKRGTPQRVPRFFCIETAPANESPAVRQNECSGPGNELSFTART